MAKTSAAKKTANPKIDAAVAAAEAAEQAAAAAEQASAEPKTRGPRGVAETAVISLKVEGNPKRAGSKAYDRFALYRDGMTVGEALNAGITTPDLVYDSKHGFVAIEGYDPGEIVQPKVREPKAPKEPKAKKVKPAPAAVDPEVEKSAKEETLD